MKKLVLLFWFLPMALSAQVPFYYKFKKVSGDLVQADGSTFSARFINRHKLEIKGCKNPDVDTLLRTLTLKRISRKYLEHLITTSSGITIDVNSRVGIVRKDGKYRLVAGLTGPGNNQSNNLIAETSNFEPFNKRKKPFEVYEENTIEIFKGSVLYFYDTTMRLHPANVVLFDYRTNQRIDLFSMDTIKIEPLMYPDLMYKNTRELYFFAGAHEIFHTTPGNIARQVSGTDPEPDAFELERRLFRHRKAINKKKPI